MEFNARIDDLSIPLMSDYNINRESAGREFNSCGVFGGIIEYFKIPEDVFFGFGGFGLCCFRNRFSFDDRICRRLINEVNYR